MKKPLVYIAAPLFTPEERALNVRLRELILPHADVYLPQLDGILFAEAIRAGADPVTTSQEIFKSDTHAIAECDALLIVLNGRTVDEGAAFELGFARALGKICAGYKEDTRQLLAVGDNPMISQALSITTVTFEQVSEWAASLQRD